MYRIQDVSIRLITCASISLIIIYLFQFSLDIVPHEIIIVKCMFHSNTL